MKRIVRPTSLMMVAAILLACGSLPPRPEPTGISAVTQVPAAPKPKQRLIAVLPIDLSHAKKKIDVDAQASIEEMLRDAATNALASNGWIVMNNQTTLQLLEDNGVNPNECGNEECHLSTARKIKAEKFISGAVQFVDGKFTASIRLIDSDSGHAVVSEHVSATTAFGLRETFDAKAEAFFRRAGMLNGPVQASTGDTPADSEVPPPEVANHGPVAKKKAIKQEVGRIVVNAKPKGLVRLEVAGPDGAKHSAGSSYENAEVEPGRWTVTAKASGYEDETQTVEVATDEVKAINFDLKPLGGLSVMGEPEGAAATVSGPGGFTDSGGVGSDWSGLKRGTYTVKVTRKGYVDGEKSVTVEPGKIATVRIALVRVSAAPVRTVASSDETFRAAGLEWQKKIVPSMKWTEAKRFCADLVLAGGGWRLPSKDELIALSREAMTNPVVARMPEIIWNCLASSSSGADPFYVDMNSGNAVPVPASYPDAVRCCR